MAGKKEKRLSEILARIHKAGIGTSKVIPEEDQLPTLGERIKQILFILKSEPVKASEMTYMIMYDISEDKVRYQIAKYLLKKGCMRIQKSVFLARSQNQHFQEIHETLKEVNSYYNNEDSIILVPINASDVQGMKLIGKNVSITDITDRPNTIFF